MNTSGKTKLDGSFIIRSRFCSDLVLANFDGQLRLAWRDVTNRNQLWTIYQDYSGLTGLNKYWLRNQGNGLELCAPENSKDLAFRAEGDAWDLGGDGKFTTWNAWRVHNNNKRNLNALGNGPYDVGTFVGVWSWAGGDPNELWQAIDVTGKKNPETGRWKKISNGPDHVAVRDEDLSGSAAPICKSFNAASPTRIFDVIVWSDDYFALRNKRNDKYLYWKGPNQLLGQAESMSVRTLWKTYHYKASQDRDYIAIQPLLNADQAIRVIRDLSKPFDPNVGSWDWSRPSFNNPLPSTMYDSSFEFFNVVNSWD